MKVVLRKDVPTLGKAGDVKEVADGYGRNFLIPRGLAAPATKTALENVASHQAALLRQTARREADHQALAKQLEERPATVRARTGDQGRLYGSVTSGDIADVLTRMTRQPVDKRWVEMDDPIRTLGDHKVKVRIAHGVLADVTVRVEAE